MDNKEYSSEEIEQLYNQLLKKYDNDLDGVNVKCKIKKLKNEFKYFYEVDSIPTHKCVALKFINLINKRKNKRNRFNPKFKDNKFN